jgi:hypothetical protein
MNKNVSCDQVMCGLSLTATGAGRELLARPGIGPRVESLECAGAIA